jgi:RNA 3'-terminal phosphate cyclase (ATP)
MLSIDGSCGEGGGQIVRSSLALAAVTGQSVSIHRVRAGRKKPGLMRQHLAAAKAVAKVSRGRLRGAAIGSTCLSFEPQGIVPGEYVFRVSTAGSAVLVLQTVLPALLTASEPSTLHFEGGTHNPHAPPFDFLEQVYLPLLCRMGPRVSARLERYGFYPAGGGQLTVRVQGASPLAAFDLLERGEIVHRRVRSLVAHLPDHIARRECQEIGSRSGWDPGCFHCETIRDCSGPGNVVLVEIGSREVRELFTGFGRKGTPAERVAAEAWSQAEEYLAADVPVGRYLADQLILLFGLAAHGGKGGRFRTLPLTPHATTHLEILAQFLEVGIEVHTAADGTCTVSMTSPSSPTN